MPCAMQPALPSANRSVITCRSQCRGLSLVKSRRRKGPSSGARRRLTADLSFCSVTGHSLATAVSQPLIQDAAASAVIMLASASLIFALSFIRTQGLLDRSDTRKISHILSGPLFLAAWPLYSGTNSSALISALPPGIYALFLVLVGSGAVDIPAMASSISRSGGRAELLRGPFVYALVLFTVAVDIVGRRVGQTRLPWNRGKSVEGSFAMFACGGLMSCGLVLYFHSLGLITYNVQVVLGAIFATSLVSTAVESLPATILDDNVSVPLVAAGVSFVLGAGTA